MKIRKITSVLLAILTVMAVLCMAACSEGESAAPENPAPTVSENVKTMRGQGNPTTISLADIVETDRAWVKISTLWDPELSMFASDSLPRGTYGVAVTFSVGNFDCGESELYWCYELVSGENAVSVWDESSPADTLKITRDGKYMMVFDAEKALGGTLDEIHSLQIVFPCGEDTNTKMSVLSVECITSPDELSNYSTGFAA